jgi:hypothetical protein
MDKGMKSGGRREQRLLADLYLLCPKTQTLSEIAFCAFFTPIEICYQDLCQQRIFLKVAYWRLIPSISSELARGSWSLVAARSN